MTLRLDMNTKITAMDRLTIHPFRCAELHCPNEPYAKCGGRVQNGQEPCGRLFCADHLRQVREPSRNYETVFCPSCLADHLGRPEVLGVWELVEDRAQ